MNLENKTRNKNKDIKNNNKKFKEDYFKFYDDIKSHTHKIIDW